jgi:type II secretory pathway component PulF
MNAEDLVALNDEIAAMARAGLPLDQGLEALARDMGRGRLRRVTAALAEDLRAGKTLPEALDAQKQHVPAFYAGLVSAGVRTGRIGEVLATLSLYGRTLANLRWIVLDAIFYPAVILLFGVALFGFVCYYVLPQFSLLFTGFNMQLPLLTEFVLALGQRPLLYVVLPLACLAAGFWLVRFSLLLSEPGRRSWARFVYSLPVFGTLLRSARLAAFSELLAILVDHEVPLPEAFRLAGLASSDPIMATTAVEVSEDLRHGAALGDVLRGRGLVPEWVSWMTGLGERRGTLGPALHQVAELYRRQAEMRAALLRSVLPPFMIVSIGGVFVVFFAFALMMPMIKLLDGLSK